MIIKKILTIRFYFFSSDLELNLKRYLTQHNSSEIFVACIGLISGKRGNSINYEIHRLLPFPNLSPTPELRVIPPENWEQILNETLKLENLNFLGFIHTHVDAISKKSQADTSYALQLSRDHGSIIMGIIGKGLTLRMYHVADGKFNIIKGESQYFKVRLK